MGDEMITRSDFSLCGESSSPSTNLAAKYSKPSKLIGIVVEARLA